MSATASNESWKTYTLIWQESQHPFDDLGLVVDYKPTDDDPLFASVYIWREQNLNTLTETIIDMISNSAEFMDSPKILTGAILAILAISHFPLQVEIIEDDEQAKNFLSLIQKIRGVHFILKDDLSAYPELTPLLEYFIKNKVLTELDEQYVFAGKVLNRSHIKD